MALDLTHCVRRGRRLTVRFLHTPFVAMHDAIISDPPAKRKSMGKETTRALVIFFRDQFVLTKETSS